MNWKFWTRKDSPALPVLKCEMDALEQTLLDHLVVKKEEWRLRLWENNSIRADCAGLGVTVLSGPGRKPDGYILGIPATFSGDITASCGAKVFGSTFATRWHGVASAVLRGKVEEETRYAAQLVEAKLKEALKL